MSDFDRFFRPRRHGVPMDPVIIVGGGYAGLSAALQLSKSDAEVILLDRAPAFTHLIRLHKTVYRPLAEYQVSYAALARRYGFRYEQCELDLKVLLDQAGRGVLDLPFAQTPFSALIIATGGQAARPLPGALTIDEIRRVDLAPRIKELLGRERLRIAIGGGGATGLQFLFELADFFSGMRKKVELFLLDPGERLLSAFPGDFHDYVVQKIKKYRISYERMSLDSYLIEGEKVDLAFSFAGVRETLPLAVSPTGQLAGGPVFAAGDTARYPQGMDAFDAQAAVRKARLVADNVVAMQAGQPLKDYNYRSLGAFVSLGFWDGLGWIFGENRLVSGLSAFALKETIEAQFLLYLAGLDTYIKVS